MLLKLDHLGAAGKLMKRCDTWHQTIVDIKALCMVEIVRVSGGAARHASGGRSGPPSILFSRKRRPIAATSVPDYLSTTAAMKSIPWLGGANDADNPRQKLGYATPLVEHIVRPLAPRSRPLYSAAGHHGLLTIRYHRNK